MVYSLSIITSIYHYERSIPCRKFSQNPLWLARNLLSKMCAELIEFLKKIIISPDFIDRNRQSKANFTRQRKQSLVRSMENADAILKGVIRTIRTQTISRIGTEVANEREVIMTLDLRLIKQNGEVIWTAKGLSGRQAYDVSDLKLENDRNESLAIARLSERISERIFSRLTDDF